MNNIVKNKITSVDVNTGLFKINLENSLQKGFLYFINKEANEIIAAEQFTLIMNVNVNVQASSTQMIDIFGERISVRHKKNEIIPKEIKLSYLYH